MKYRLMEMLACPECGNALELSVFHALPRECVATSRATGCRRWCAYRGTPVGQGDRPEPCDECRGVEVEEGLLTCIACSGLFPVTEGVPRLLAGALDDWPAFVTRWKDKSPALAARVASTDPRRREFEARYRATQRSFEFEWLEFRETEDNDLVNFRRRSGKGPDELRGRTVLDVGCGMGRYLRLLAPQDGCDVVGLDLGRAAERAQRELGALRPNVHLVQGNLMHPPFRPGSFDLVYSLGVLHHTPNTAQAFKSIVPLVAKGGELAVWVYYADMLRHPLRLWVSDALRSVTTRMPPRWVYYLAHLAGPLGWAQQVLLRRRWTTLLGAPLFLFTVRIKAPWRIRVMDTYDWYAPRYQWKHTHDEVRGWFEAAGFSELRRNPEDVSFSGRRPRFS
ncbi:MAG: methyltransferase domain-containing protein [Candidatus Rokubacteria bacterium]|nr:methyltransferase domain-containing protein [Candidatus Rokubacteria bacterium]